MNFDVQSIRGRRKQPKHLIEKIIRKRGKEKSQKYLGINVNNYKEIVRDLIGIRILTISKEEWEIVHDWLIKKFNPDIHAIADITAETNSKSEVQMESSQKIDLSESINRVILRKEH